jgi:hypothetical protein
MQNLIEMALQRGNNGEVRTEGEIWVLSLGLGLQPPIACAGFRTLSLASVQSLRRRATRLMKLALDGACTQASCTVRRKRGSTSWKWLNQDCNGLEGLSNKLIQWFSCVNSTPQSISERAKQRDISGFRTFHRYFDSLSQQGFLLLIITSIKVDI